MKKWERNIPIMELIWKVVLNWKKIILCSIICAIIAITFGYVQELRTYRNSIGISNEQATDEKKVESLSVQELQGIEDAKVLVRRMADTREYMENSILMKIDPYQEAVLTLNYYVDLNKSHADMSEADISISQDIVKAYKESIDCGVLAEYIIENSEIDCQNTEYIQELVQTKAVEDSSVISVTMVYKDQNTLENIADVVEDGISMQMQNVSQNIDTHRLNLVSKFVSVRVDVSLAQNQRYYQDMMYSYQTELNGLKSLMSAEQLKELNGEGLSEDDSLDDVQNSEMDILKPALNKKYMVLGFLGGCVLAVIWAICRILLEHRLQFATELTDGYDIRILGIFETAKSQSMLDKYLYRIKNLNTKQMSRAEKLDSVCIQLELMCKKQNISNIFLTGTSICQMEDELLEMLKGKLHSVNIECECGECVCYNVESLKQMINIKNVVLVEKIGVSEYKDIEKEIKMIKEQDGRILGCLVVD